LIPRRTVVCDSVTVSSPSGLSPSSQCSPSSSSDASIISTSEESAGRLQGRKAELAEVLRAEAVVGANELGREPDTCDAVETLRLLAVDAGREVERSSTARLKS
jgi:hypothetical protein